MEVLSTQCWACFVLLHASAGVTQEEGRYRGGFVLFLMLSHLPPAVLAVELHARRVQQSLPSYLNSMCIFTREIQINKLLQE